jgi:uncharacterized protein (TIGR03083 family)
VDSTAHVSALQHEGDRLADTAEQIDLSVAVPTCPDWTLRDLLRHIGGVHRWAGEHIRDRREKILRVDDLETLFGSWPADHALVEWYRDELRLLVNTFREAPSDIQCATFLKATSPLAHWTRRQAHEVTIHRADVESIVDKLTPVSPEFGADGIDELLSAFIPRPFMKLRSTDAVTFSVKPSDSPRSWRLTISEGPVETVEGDKSPSNCTVAGTASDLYFDLWNRGHGEKVAVSGDPAVLGLFRDTVKIKWA